jgi:hypothetical protein
VATPILHAVFTSIEVAKATRLLTLTASCVWNRVILPYISHDHKTGASFFSLFRSEYVASSSMLFGHFDIVMSNESPEPARNLLVGEEETSVAYGANPYQLPALTTTADTTNKRQIRTQQSHPSRKQLKVDDPTCVTDAETPRETADGQISIGPESLLPSQIIHSNYMRNMPSLSSHPSSNTGSIQGGGLAINQVDLFAMRDQMNRNEAINAMLLSNLYAQNRQNQSNYLDLSFLANQDRQQNHVAALQHQLQTQLTSLPSLNQMNHALYGNTNISRTHPGYPAMMSAQHRGPSTSEHLASLLRQIQASNDARNSTQNGNAGNLSNIVRDNVRQQVNTSSPEVSRYELNQQNLAQRQPLLLNGNSNLDLPVCIEGKLKPYSERPFFPLGVSEDPNWLSEFHCFVRSELVEVYCASHDDVTGRNNSITYYQVGIRCRFCAHLPSSSRAGRSSAFPSSLRQIYQSFTMMLRDHFANCDAIPASVRLEYDNLKDKPAQGATDSKRFWMYSAKKVGLADTTEGIMITQESRREGTNLTSFGAAIGQNWEDDAYRDDSLVRPTDRGHVSEFLFLLISQVQPIRLTETECIGNRRSLQVGLPGFGCRYCCDQRRLGLCRMFPARRRTLPHKVNDLYDHLRRCTLCPQVVKDSLEETKQQMTTSIRVDQGNDREFYDRLWSRLGHSGVSASNS